jgi:hypothetical protein
MKIVEADSMGRKFKVVDPSTYCIATYEFTDEVQVKKFWEDVQPDETVMAIHSLWDTRRK